MSKNRFYIYTEYLNYLDGMSDSDQALLFRTMLKYENGDELEELTPVVKAVWGFIKARMDNLDKKYQETCEARSRAGSKGGEAKASKRKQKIANTSKCQQELANVADNEYEYENEIDKENNTPPTPQGASETKTKRFVKPTPEEVQAYCDERSNGISGEDFVDFYESKGWLIGKTPMKNWKAAVRTWEKSRGFKYVPPDKTKPPDIPNKYADYEKVTFDDD